MQAPRIEKVTLNMGVGEAVGDRKIMEAATGDMTLIAGNRADGIVRYSSKVCAECDRGGSTLERWKSGHQRRGWRRH